MRLRGRRIAILVEQQYQDLEVWVPYYRLKEEGAEVHLVGAGASSYAGKYGYPAKPDLSIDQIQPDAYDGVVIPGGWAPDFLRRHPKVVEFVRRMHRAGKTVASICHGGWLLASAEIVAGRRLTSFSAIRDDLIHAGAKFVDEEVVVDGNLITSRTPEDLPAFCRALVAALESSRPAAAAVSSAP